jgi:hypothetical protein
MSKGVFDQDFSEITEFDSSLDINDVFSRLPDEESEEPHQKAEEETKDKSEEVGEDLQYDINDILESNAESDDDDEDSESGSEYTSDREDIDDEGPVPDNTKQKNSSEAPFTVIFAKDLMEQGLLSSFDEEVFNEQVKELGEASALRNLIKAEIDTNISLAKDDLDEGYQSYLTLLDGGYSQEDATSISSLQKRFGGIKADQLDDDSNEELRKQVLTDYFKLTSQMSDEKIRKVVQRSIDLGDDIEESKESLESIKVILKEQIKTQEEENKNQAKLREQQHLQSLDTLKDTINSITEILPGQTINKQTKDKLYDLLIKPVTMGDGRTTNAVWAKRMEDAMYFDSRLAYLLETGFFEKNKPWNKLKNVKVTKEVSQLEEALKRNKNTGSRSGRSVGGSTMQDPSLRKTLDATRSILKR